MCAIMSCGEFVQYIQVLRLQVFYVNCQEEMSRLIYTNSLLKEECMHALIKAIRSPFSVFLLPVCLAVLAACSISSKTVSGRWTPKFTNNQK